MGWHIGIPLAPCRMKGEVGGRAARAGCGIATLERANTAARRVPSVTMAGHSLGADITQIGTFEQALAGYGDTRRSRLR